MELFEFEGEDVTKEKDGGVRKRIFTAGDGLDHPNDGAMVDIEFKVGQAAQSTNRFTVQ